MSTHYVGGQRFGARFDWAAIVAAVVVGLGVTLLLVALGIAIGALAVEQAVAGEPGTISAVVGGWTIASALIGAFVGTFVGGRYSRAVGDGNAAAHGATSWSLVTVLTVWFGATGVVGLLGSALAGVAPQVVDDPGAAPTGVALPGIPEEAIGWGGWALFLGLALTLAISILGWWLGERTRPVTVEPDAPAADVPVQRERTEVGARR